MTRWSFAIDVGGTFTDCVARAPDGSVHTLKVLSSGLVPGRIAALDGTDVIDPARDEPEQFWNGCAFQCAGQEVRIVASDASGRLRLDRPISVRAGDAYVLAPGQEAPILAIRKLLGLPLGAPIPPLDVRLGTTRGTNALLTRRGARTALVTTRGFQDLLHIGSQERPRLFDLAIRKRLPLCETVVEIDERIAVDGQVLRAPDPAAVRQTLEALRAAGIRSLAICFLHGFAHPAHERRVAALAREVGFDDISVSSEVAPLEKIVWRAETTVADAYLSPVLRGYVAGLRRALGQGSVLHLMTSSGGLVGAESFRGRDSILSGPAGGVVACARVATQSGFDQAIGFDMGGTSTDVSRFGGRFELQFETEKAGVRIIAPMMAIETVAAGGGSICSFDGVKLTVGPDSAGADPGPACYGRGGPLTITDINLLLGKLLPERFPFPLDVEAARARLAEVANQIGMAELLLAQGFLEVANATMVRAIRSISIARGYDPADHVLVAFGAAGGQHACALARELGIRRVLCHAHAGVMSAYGIAVADVRRFRERSLLTRLDAAAFEPVFVELERAAHADVASDGVAPERIQPGVRHLDLRYVGQDAFLTIPSPENGDWAAAFEAEHERRYGYRDPGRAIEAVAARVEVVGRSEPFTTSETAHKLSGARTRRSAWFGGREYETEVLLRESLSPDEIVDGPAIVCEPTATIVVDPGWQARLGEHGALVLEDRAGAPRTTRESTAADPVRLEVFNHRFAAIAEQMGVTLRRTASSTNVKERLDFSCALFTADGALVVSAQHIPVHLGAMSETVRAVLAECPEMSPGDVFVTNDPYRGGSHLPDITVVTPLHDDRGQLLFLCASRAHHADVGGVVPGSMPPFSRTLDEEGVLLPPFKLVERGRFREAEIRARLGAGPHPARRIDDNVADLAAQVAANQAGLAGLRELCARHGLEVVQAYMRHIQDAAAQKMRRALAGLPKGAHGFVDHLDDGTPIAVTITVEGEQAIVDFDGTGPVVSGNLNANRAITTAAVLYCFRCLIDEDIPLNSGVLAPIEIRIPKGCLLDPPPPAAVVGGNVETSQRLCDVVLGALGVAAASQGTMNNLSFGDGTFGYYETLCGGAGATPDADGADAVHTHMTNTRLTDPEVLERRYPVRLVRFAIRRGSGGKGRHRGGDGVVRELEALRPLRASILSERRGPYPPYGLAGGEPGALGRNLLVRDGETTVLPGKIGLDLLPGDRLILETPGGGGHGAPRSAPRSRPA